MLTRFRYAHLSAMLPEANGLTDGYRRLKLPIATIRGIVLGETVDRDSQRRPNRALGQARELQD